MDVFPSSVDLIASGHRARCDYVQLTRALAELRLGHPQNAVDLLQGGPSTVLQPMPQLILAISQQQLGQAAHARKTLDSAVGMFNWDRNRAIDLDVWSFHILLREAEGAIRPEPAVDRK